MLDYVVLVIFTPVHLGIKVTKDEVFDVTFLLLHVFIHVIVEPDALVRRSAALWGIKVGELNRPPACCELYLNFAAADLSVVFSAFFERIFVCKGDAMVFYALFGFLALTFSMAFVFSFLFFMIYIYLYIYR